MEDSGHPKSGPKYLSSAGRVRTVERMYRSEGGFPGKFLNLNRIKFSGLFLHERTVVGRIRSEPVTQSYER
jgi:hypothetical protein